VAKPTVPWGFISNAWLSFYRTNRISSRPTAYTVSTACHNRKVGQADLGRMFDLNIFMCIGLTTPELNKFVFIKIPKHQTESAVVALVCKAVSGVKEVQSSTF
jgi:hypothetical protein